MRGLCYSSHVVSDLSKILLIVNAAVADRVGRVRPCAEEGSKPEPASLYIQPSVAWRAFYSIM